MLNLLLQQYSDLHMVDVWCLRGVTAHGAYLLFVSVCVSFHVYSSVVWFSSSSSSSSSRADYWRKRAEQDTGGVSTNPHILAERIISRGGPITHNDINNVLEDQGISITQEELEEMKAIQPESYSLSALDIIKRLFPKNDKGWVIYQFVNNITGLYYYGSSSNFGLRLRHYLKSHSDLNLRSILSAIRETGISNFTLHVYTIPMHLREERLLLALEQYYILMSNPAYNDLKVVNKTPGGMRLSEHNSVLNSVPLYVLLDGQLIYVFDSLNGLTNNAMTGLSASTNTILNCLDTGDLFLGTLTLSRTPPNSDEGNGSLMSLEDLKNLVKETRTGKLIYTPPIVITRVEDGTTMNFPNFNEARKWLKKETGKKVDNKTMERRIKSGIPLNGYSYKSSDRSR